MKKIFATTATVLVAALAAGCATPQTGSSDATTYPSKPVNLIVSFSAGGSTDVGARLVADGLEDKLGRPVVVENKPGASGQVGNSALVSSSPDGYTMSTVSLAGTILSYLDPARGASYDHDSFDPVAMYVQDPQVFVVAPDSPYQSLQDLVAAGKAEPGKIRMATSGVATQDHVAMVLFEQLSGAQFSPVHFSDGAAPAATAFLGGNVEVLVTNVGDVQEVVANNQGKVLGVAAASRNEFLPEVPTFAEQGFDFELASSRGFVVPAGTPDEVVEKLSSTIADVMDDPATLARLKDLNLTPSFLDHTASQQLWDQTESSFASVLDQVKADV
ncbi:MULTISPECIES: tripartite tricarboxylate transporter substrate binding protein [unclassified Pseudonocardia]|uniref:Bug family tripartite tricarboxylate transporter substrate binding protein n=1 Tax=unclassified Pseudonocardia TaxID=2619320 RepID=UPI001CF61FA9|nr:MULTISPECIES: tripartite tricarboxylate transporter substrate binding protein [unclassified Pseudonocardia]